MTKSMHRIINVATNEITDVEFTAEELAAYEAAERLSRIASMLKLKLKPTFSIALELAPMKRPSYFHNANEL